MHLIFTKKTLKSLSAGAITLDHAAENNALQTPIWLG